LFGEVEGVLGERSMVFGTFGKFWKKVWFEYVDLLGFVVSACGKLSKAFRYHASYFKALQV